MAGLAWALWLLATAAAAQPFSGLASVVPGASTIAAGPGGGVRVDLALSQGVPWRVFTLDAPRRLVVDFREVDWRGLDPEALVATERVDAARVGRIRPGWSRMIVDLSGPFLLDNAGLRVAPGDGTARLRIILAPGTDAAFAAAAGTPDLPGWDLPRPPADKGAAAPRRRQRGTGPLVVMLDPGHGGVDPGAQVDGLSEKDVMLTFARELREELLRAGGFKVVLTRDADEFVSLERRVALAHRADVDVFVSLHADALSGMQAHGASVYTLSDSASDKASAALAERHDRADILSGIDLTGKDDVVADVLMDLARMETQPRADALSGALVAAIGKAGLPLLSRPGRAAGFSVLKAPDIPSILLELGFLSSPRDHDNLRDPAWRARMAQAVRAGLAAWRQADAAGAHLVRQ